MAKKDASEKAEATPAADDLKPQTIEELMADVARIEGMLTRVLTLNSRLEQKVNAATESGAGEESRYKELEDRVDTFEARVQFIRDETLPRLKKVEDVLRSHRWLQ